MQDDKLRFRRHATQEHLLQSNVVAQTFRIKVQQPMSRADHSERFPVLYVTDSDDFFGGLKNLAAIMQGFGEVPRFILVGIGYDNSAASESLRMRDLLPRDIRTLFREEIEQVFNSAFVSGLDNLDIITNTTDAREFQRFISDELMPFINSRYPTLPDDCTYFGYSAGGAFGLYTLFTEPQTFCRYILGSPATSYGGRPFAIEMAKSFAKTGRPMEARVFMSVGELEEFKRGYGQFDLVTGFYQLAKHLKNSPIANLHLTTRVFPDETHATAWTLAFSHGLRSLLGAVEQVPYWPEFLK